MKFISALILIEISLFLPLSESWAKTTDKVNEIFRRVMQQTNQRRSSKEKDNNKKYLELAMGLANARYYFSSIIIAKKYMSNLYQNSSGLSGGIDAKVKERDTKRLEELLTFLQKQVGTSMFASFSDQVLNNYNSAAMRLVLVLRNFELKKYPQALSAIAEFKDFGPYQPEIEMVKGTIHAAQNDNEQAKKDYANCLELGSKMAKDAEDDKVKRYYDIVHDSCQIQLARIAFSDKNYGLADQQYNLIEKTSYLWPYTLLEKAWANYHLENYNRTLGILVTYRSPLLESYFIPEAEALIALSYFKLCLWDDAAMTIDRYYKVYKKQSEELVTMLNSQKMSDNFFYDMSVQSIVKSSQMAPYIRNLVTQVRKQVKFNVDIASIFNAERELKHISNEVPGKLSTALKQELAQEIVQLKRGLNHFIKKQMFDFVNDIHSISYELFNVQLEILSKQRKLLYDDKKLIATRSRGDYSNVHREKDQYFWEFQGEFWADELSDYSFGLKSNCEVIREGDA
jgi:predicted negative regulator of RcsB-dependent stress response